MKLLLKLALLTSLAVSLTSCGGGGSSSTWGAYQSPEASADYFVNGLNNTDGALPTDESFVVLYDDQTERHDSSGKPWFVIYDAKYDEYKAVNLNYLREIVYHDYYANSTGLAEEFRSIETDDILAGWTNGDVFGDDYEVVDYNSFSGYYEGRVTGFEYEDEEESTDVALLAAEKEQLKFFKKASQVSYTYDVGIETSLSLVTLGSKVESIMKKGKGELTSEDQNALMADLEKLAGVSMSEIMEASLDQKKKEDVVRRIAKKIGTSTQNLQDRILPDLLGIQL